MERTRARGRWVIGSSGFSPELIIVDFPEKILICFFHSLIVLLQNKINVV